MARSHRVINLPWTESFVTYYSYASGLLWPVESHGSSVSDDLSFTVLTDAAIGLYGSSFSWDVTGLQLNWEDHGQVGISLATTVAATYTFFSLQSTLGTTAWYPHITVRFEDDPPATINDLRVEPDTSLTESSYTHRQRANLKWTASDASDFYRYRLRKGINRSQAADHTHLAFVYSRGSTSYIDSTLYTNGSTIYYSLYTEDGRNRSASTNTNVSNIVSWTKPHAIIGSVNYGSSASTLDEVEVRTRATAMATAKKIKVIWGDGAYSFSQNQTSAGGYFYARHRFTKATSGYTMRALVEDIYGFRSSLDSYATSFTVSNLGPVAKIVASPTRTKTGSTFSFGGLGLGAASSAFRRIEIQRRPQYHAPADCIALSFRFNPDFAITDASTSLLHIRDEGAFIRIVNKLHVTTATADAPIRRDINWLMRKGDGIGTIVYGGAGIRTLSGGTFADGHWTITGWSSGSTLEVGKLLPQYRFIAGSAYHAIAISYALTNPIHFSAKDSFARGSNKFINRFRWMPNYAGNFSAGATYTTGATTSFYWAWTTATTQFMAARAVDNSHASSTDTIGVVIETESTFRFPDDLRDGVNASIQDSRERQYTLMPTLSKDYGTLDLGSIGPRTIKISGTAYTLSSTTSNFIDIERIYATFQQKKKCYVQLPFQTASSAIVGYVVEPPITYSTDDPAAAKWNLTVAVVA